MFLEEDERLKDDDIIDLCTVMSIVDGHPQEKDYISKVFREIASEKGW